MLNFHQEGLSELSIISKKTGETILSILFSGKKWSFDRDRTNPITLEIFHQRGIQIPNKKIKDYSKRTLAIQDDLFLQAFFELVAPRRYPPEKYSYLKKYGRNRSDETSH